MSQNILFRFFVTCDPHTDYSEYIFADFRLTIFRAIRGFPTHSQLPIDTGFRFKFGAGWGRVPPEGGRGHRATLPGSLTEGNKSLGLIFKVYPRFAGDPCYWLRAVRLDQRVRIYG
jgi:hypothetical protein